MSIQSIQERLTVLENIYSQGYLAEAKKKLNDIEPHHEAPLAEQNTSLDESWKNKPIHLSIQGVTPEDSTANLGELLKSEKLKLTSVGEKNCLINVEVDAQQKRKVAIKTQKLNNQNVLVIKISKSELLGKINMSPVMEIVDALQRHQTLSGVLEQDGYASSSKDAAMVDEIQKQYRQNLEQEASSDLKTSKNGLETLTSSAQWKNKVYRDYCSDWIAAKKQILQEIEQTTRSNLTTNFKDKSLALSFQLETANIYNRESGNIKGALLSLFLESSVDESYSPALALRNRKYH